jgi:hypothetical protein
VPNKIDKREIGMLDLRAAFNPTSANKDKRTVELVWSTGAPVMRGFWEPFFEELSMDPAHIRMDRMAKGAPLLNTHDQGTLENQLGVVERAWIDGKEGKAIVRFSERETVKPFMQDVFDGIIRNVSVGYRVYKYEDKTPQPTVEVPTPTRVMLAVDWEPFEISLVPIPADQNATVRSAGFAERNEVIVLQRADAQMEESKMPQTNPAPVANGVDAQPNIEQIRKEARDAELSRGLEIRKLVKSVKLDETFAEQLVSSGASIDEARKEIIDAVAAQADKNATRGANPSVVVTRDETVTHREAIGEALMHRINPGKNKMTEKGQDFAGLTLIEMAREHLTAKGVKVKGLSRMELAGRSFHSTSDFPSILADTINKTLRASYESSPRTFQPFCKQASASDFKTISRNQISDYPSLEKVNESGEFKYGSMSDGKETYSLATYGKIIGLTRQTLINDDLSALSSIPQMIGAAAADLESDIVWGIVTANANLSDGVALFHATHGNLASASVISVTSLGEGKAKLRAQKNLQSRPINLIPGFIMVPVALETVAQQFISNAYVAQESGKINPFAGQLQLLVEPRLDANSASKWYMSAAPGRIDTIEYCYLEGQSGVYTETEMGFEVDGMKIKARHDFAAKAIDYRGLFRNG